MTYDDVLILRGNEVVNLLHDRELEIMDAVQAAYQSHNLGDSCLPHSSFVRFPDKEKDRIIALPAYLGGELSSAGIKWIASFPQNLELGMERASAVLVLNSTDTGHVQAIMESSVVSAKRTAASAALAAHTLRGDQHTETIGMIGCGLINFETFRFLLARRPEIDRLLIFDLDRARAEQFREQCAQLSNRVDVRIVDGLDAIFRNSAVTTLATTAIEPHIDDLSTVRPGGVILHTSLRDLSPDIILAADNVVDDVDHVCRAETSVHLAEQRVGHRRFIRCTLGDILNGRAPARGQNGDVSIFSPFGLGVLDLAVAQLAFRHGAEQGVGTMIDEFLPTPWMQRAGL